MIFPHTKKASEAHAINEYPRESCGIVVDDKYIPCKNLSTNKDSIKINPKEHPHHWMNHSVQAIIHSHPNGPLYPSEADMLSQVKTNLPWGIIGTNGQTCDNAFWLGDNLSILEYVGRPFRHGVTDCYTLIRDWYRKEEDVVLPVFPRGWFWWKEGKQFYNECFNKAGFEKVNVHNNPQVGDVFFAQIKSPTPNHAGIYVGKGKILHHCGSNEGYDPSKLSTIEPVNVYADLITTWLRRIK